MKERPILFSAPMVRALLEGTKTQTRRVVARGNSVLDWDGGPLTKWPGLDFAGKIHPGFPRAFSAGALRSSEGAPRGVVSLCTFATGLPNYRPGDHTAHRVYPRWRVGDRLWVKETFGPCAGGVVFRADDGNDCPDGGRWRPSIFMPRWASRITLEITGVRVERLHDISEEDAIAEGCLPPPPQRGGTATVASFDMSSPIKAFERLWRGINGADSWFANPWVWALTFKRVTP